MILALALSCAHPSPADTLLTNGVIYPMDGAQPAEALAIRDGEIAFVGAARRAERYAGPETEVRDLDGAVVLPGFIDAHNHLVWSGTELLDVDLYDATTLAELLDAVAARAEAAPEEPWVRGGGWDVSLFNDSLHRSQLDEIVPDRPVYLSSADAHSAWVNSEALALAGITADTPDPQGGRVERDEDGEPTGVLREGAADMMAELLPDYSEEQVEAGLASALQEAASLGITALIDPNCEDWMLAGYRAAEAAGGLTARVFAAVEVDPGDDGPAKVAAAAAWGSDRVVVNAAKLYLDGVMESQTALMLAPYTDGTNGEALWADDELARAVTALDAAGWQIHAHAIGDGAVRQILDAIEAADEENGRRDRRPLLAHLELIDDDDVPRFASLGVYADFQMLWAYPDAYITEWTVPYIGEARAAGLYPIGAVLDAGGVLVAGSDWSVSSMNPWEAIEVAVTRVDPWDGGEALNAGQAISVDAAIRAYTADGARAIFSEDRLGTLTVGKRADLVVLDRDPFAVEAEALSDVGVVETWLDGARVYAR